MKYCWLNINTGEFSNSWNQKEHDLYFGEDKSYNEKDLKEAAEQGWKVIQYTCINDNEFDFSNIMKIVTNVNKLPKKKVNVKINDN